MVVFEQLASFNKKNNTKDTLTLRKKCPNMEYFLVRILENTDQKKLRIRTLFTQCEGFGDSKKRKKPYEVMFSDM